MCRFKIEHYYGLNGSHRYTTYVEQQHLAKYYPKQYQAIMEDINCVGVLYTVIGSVTTRIRITDLWKTY